MDLREVIEKRRSVRHFREDPVPNELVEELIDLAWSAPSAGGIRGYHIVVTKRQVVGYAAPVYLVVCARPEAYVARYGDRGRDLYAVQDATIAAAYIQLLAVDAGLATVWVGAFREEKVRGALGLPDSLRPVAVLPLGYERRDADFAAKQTEIRRWS